MKLWCAVAFGISVLLPAGVMAQEADQILAQEQQIVQPNQDGASAPAAPEPVMLFVRSAMLVDQQGATVGYLEGVVLDPASGQVSHALGSVASPNMRSVVTPIPWQTLVRQPDADLGSSGGKFQKFAVPVPRSVLLGAPRLNLARLNAASDRSWMAASSSYFQAAAAGAGVRGSGVIAQPGGASTIAGVSPAVNPLVTPSTLGDLFSVGTNMIGSNFMSTLFGTNFVSTNRFAFTNPAFSTNLFTALTNFFNTNTSGFRTNQFPDALARLTNFFLPRTNVFVGTNPAPGNVGAPPQNFPPQRGTNTSGTFQPGGATPPTTPGTTRPGFAPPQPAVPPVAPENPVPPEQIPPGAAPGTPPNVPVPAPGVRPAAPGPGSRILTPAPAPPAGGR